MTQDYDPVKKYSIKLRFVEEYTLPDNIIYPLSDVN